MLLRSQIVVSKHVELPFRQGPGSRVCGVDPTSLPGCSTATSSYVFESACRERCQLGYRRFHRLLYIWLCQPYRMMCKRQFLQATMRWIPSYHVRQMATRPCCRIFHALRLPRRPSRTIARIISEDRAWYVSRQASLTDFVTVSVVRSSSKAYSNASPMAGKNSGLTPYCTCLSATVQTFGGSKSGQFSDFHRFGTRPKPHKKGCFWVAPSSSMISLNSSMSGPSMFRAVSSISIKYEACIRNRFDARSSGECGSTSMGKPNNTLVDGWISKSFRNNRLPATSS